jgi:hypothetical protein
MYNYITFMFFFLSCKRNIFSLLEKLMQDRWNLTIVYHSSIWILVQVTFYQLMLLFIMSATHIAKIRWASVCEMCYRNFDPSFGPSLVENSGFPIKHARRRMMFILSPFSVLHIWLIRLEINQGQIINIYLSITFENIY